MLINCLKKGQIAFKPDPQNMQIADEIISLIKTEPSICDMETGRRPPSYRLDRRPVRPY